MQKFHNVYLDVDEIVGVFTKYKRDYGEEGGLAKVTDTDKIEEVSIIMRSGHTLKLDGENAEAFVADWNE